MITWYADIDIMKKVLVRLFVVFCLVASSLLVAPFSVVNADIEMVTFDNTCIYSHPLITWTYENNQYYSNIKIYFKGSYRGEAKFALHFQLGQSGGGTYYNWEQVKAFNGEYVECVIRNTQPVFPDTCTATVSQPNDVFRINEYTEIFPFESYEIQSYNLSMHTQIGIDRMYSYTYNIFQIDSNDTSLVFGVTYLNTNEDAYLILGLNRDITSITDIRNYIKSSNLYLSDYEIISSSIVDGNPWDIIKVTCHCIDGNEFARVSFNSYDTTWKYMPIYFKSVNNTNVTTDFALLFGLDNRLLLAIENIQPNISTDESADNLDIESNDFSDAADNLFGYEDDFNNDLNDSLDDINVNFDVGNAFGSKFLNSAQWVRQQFDALTNTTPFGTVLSFSLILGLALLIIGKAVR